MKKKVNKHKSEEQDKDQYSTNLAIQQIKQPNIFSDPSNKTQQNTAIQFKVNQPQKKNPKQINKKQKRSTSQKTNKRPGTQLGNKKPPQKSPLLNLTPAQFQQYQYQLEQEQQTSESDEEDEQDVLLKKHDLFGIKQKDAKFQKPIMLKVAELGQFSSFGDEEILMKCKKRIFSVVCTSAQGELISVTKRDFELRVLTDYTSKNFYKEQVKNIQNLILNIPKLFFQYYPRYFKKMISIRNNQKKLEYQQTVSIIISLTQNLNQTEQQFKIL